MKLMLMAAAGGLCALAAPVWAAPAKPVAADVRPANPGVQPEPANGAAPGPAAGRKKKKREHAKPALVSR